MGINCPHCRATFYSWDKLMAHISSWHTKTFLGRR